MTGLIGLLVTMLMFCFIQNWSKKNDYKKRLAVIVEKEAEKDHLLGLLEVWTSKKLKK